MNDHSIPIHCSKEIIFCLYLKYLEIFNLLYRYVSELKVFSTRASRSISLKVVVVLVVVIYSKYIAIRTYQHVTV